jgi:hypothetical protein
MQFARHSGTSSIFVTSCNWWYWSQNTQFQNHFSFVCPNLTFSILYVLFHYSSFCFLRLIFIFTHGSTLNTSLFWEEWEAPFTNYLYSVSVFSCQRYSSEQRINAVPLGFHIHLRFFKQCIFNYETTTNGRQKWYKILQGGDYTRHRKQHDRRCTYNVTFRRVCVITVALEKHYYIFRACVCVFIYPACKAHAPYFIVICGLSGCTISFHIIL